MKREETQNVSNSQNENHRYEFKLKKELNETIFDRVIMILSTIAFCLVLLFVALQVFIRYIPKVSVPWTEESARYLMIFFTLLGSAVAMRTKEHITITTLLDLLSAKTRLILEFIIRFIILALLVVIIPGSFNNTMSMINSRVGAIPWLRVGHIYGCMTVALFLMGVYQLRWIIYYGTEIYRVFFKRGRVK